MRSWEFRKWRKTLRWTQVEAAANLGLRRGTIQRWENGVAPVPEVVEMACKQLTRVWKQRADFGPVTLVYADDSTWQEPPGSAKAVLLYCEAYPNNETALQQACELRNVPRISGAFILEQSGDVIWSGRELMEECDRRRERESQCQSRIP